MRNFYISRRPASYPVGTESFSGEKKPELEADRSSYSAEDENTWSSPSNPLYNPMVFY
jgi:hypothetical protein